MNLDKITKNGKALFLAYDHGMEHGPTDFDDQSVDPTEVLKIADSGFFTGFICQNLKYLLFDFSGITTHNYLPFRGFFYYSVYLRKRMQAITLPKPNEFDNTVSLLAFLDSFGT